jgi:hypothetical protein
MRGTCLRGTVRNLEPARDDAKPLYVNEQGARIGISGGERAAGEGRDARGSGGRSSRWT